MAGYQRYQLAEIRVEDKKTNGNEHNCKWENFPEQTERKLSHRIRNWNSPVGSFSVQGHPKYNGLHSQGFRFDQIHMDAVRRDVVKSLLRCLDDIFASIVSTQLQP